MNNFIVTFYFDLGVLDPEVESAPAPDRDALEEHVLGVEVHCEDLETHLLIFVFSLAIYNLEFVNIFIHICHVLRMNHLGFVNIHVDICHVLGY